MDLEKFIQKFSFNFKYSVGLNWKLMNDYYWDHKQLESLIGFGKRYFEVIIVHGKQILSSLFHSFE